MNSFVCARMWRVKVLVLFGRLDIEKNFVVLRVVFWGIFEDFGVVFGLESSIEVDGR